MDTETKFKVRTDLAVEMEEDIGQEQTGLKGIKVRQREIREGNIHVTRVEVLNEEGEELIGKPKGIYITLESQELARQSEGYHREMSAALSCYVSELIQEKEGVTKILVVGLGNKDATPDSLGPRVVDNLCVTRLIDEEIGNPELFQKNDRYQVSAIATGVLARTGMESAEIVKGLTKEIGADLVIAIDSLAARNSSRLNTTIQISSAGIHPGSGVGNHRQGITRETIGIPVIAIGIPTVIDAATIVNDTFDNLVEILKLSSKKGNPEQIFKEFSPEEKYELIREMIDPELSEMYVTPKDVDATVKYISYTISEGLNIIFT